MASRWVSPSRRAAPTASLTCTAWRWATPDQSRTVPTWKLADTQSHHGARRSSGSSAGVSSMRR